MHSDLKRMYVQCYAESGKLWVQEWSECISNVYSHLLHVYGMYKGGTSDLRKKGEFQARI